MKNFPIPRLDKNPEFRKHLLKYCRLKKGEIWKDPAGKHKVGCLDAASKADIKKLMEGEKATLAIHDPPYNLIGFELREVERFVDWSKQWIETTNLALDNNSSLYVWLGADQKDGFQPLPDFMIMMRGTQFKTRSFITMRNQRGYGTQKNWMAVRQELLFYTKGNPIFNIKAEYTDIPKILRGYYKEINGKITENLERSKSANIRAGNVWVDIQQVFHLMDENVNGCYAQKPLKSAERIILASSNPGDVVIDFFCHSASTLLSAEMNGRRCFTIDLDPLYCEIAIRRIERYRQTGKSGWQNSNPFEKEILKDKKLKSYVILNRNF
ncbi:MAG: site-specific DNA-methyltransferase [Ignavibacteriales bacterium]|nr:site-specific DNA-methyltransferase [Ignavibacteriales bacterium]